MFFQYPKLLWLLVVPALLVLRYLLVNCKSASSAFESLKRHALEERWKVCPRGDQAYSFHFQDSRAFADCCGNNPASFINQGSKG